MTLRNAQLPHCGTAWPPTAVVPREASSSPAMESSCALNGNLLVVVPREIGDTSTNVPAAGIPLMGPLTVLERTIVVHEGYDLPGQYAQQCFSLFTTARPPRVLSVPVIRTSYVSISMS